MENCDDMIKINQQTFRNKFFLIGCVPNFAFEILPLFPNLIGMFLTCINVILVTKCDEKDQTCGRNVLIIKFIIKKIVGLGLQTGKFYSIGLRRCKNVKYIRMFKKKLRQCENV